MVEDQVLALSFYTHYNCTQKINELFPVEIMSEQVMLHPIKVFIDVVTMLLSVSNCCTTLLTTFTVCSMTFSKHVVIYEKQLVDFCPCKDPGFNLVVIAQLLEQQAIYISQLWNCVGIQVRHIARNIKCCKPATKLKPDYKTRIVFYIHRQRQFPTLQFHLLKILCKLFLPTTCQGRTYAGRIACNNTLHCQRKLILLLL